MYIVGVYGRSGAGKSTLSKKLAESLGGVYLDVDKYWRNVYYSDYFQKIVVPLLRKDKNLVKPENTPDDGVVRIKDLKVSARLARFNRKFLYKYLNYRVNRKLKKVNTNVIVIDHINFPQFDAYKKADFVIYVNTPSEVCQKNVMKRDNITKERMDFLVENKIVECHNEFDSMPQDYSISAFSEEYENEYEKLVNLIKVNIESKKMQEQTEASKIVDFITAHHVHLEEACMLPRNK